MLIRPDMMRLTQSTELCDKVSGVTDISSGKLRITADTLVPNGSPESPAADTDNTKSIGATRLAGDSWPAGINSEVETTVSGASLPHLPLISEPNVSASSPREREKSTELLEMVELSESIAGKRKTKKNTDGEFEESAPHLMGSR